MRTLACILSLLTTWLLPAVPAHAQATRQVATVSLPFDLVGGLVVLRNLTLNGQRGDFILDTGCEHGLVVEQATFPGQLHPAPRLGLSVTGSVAMQQLAVASFEFGAAHYAGLTAAALSLAHLRPAVGPRLLGVVGYDLLREYEVVIDYTHRRLSCYPLHPARPTPRPFVRQDSLAFTLVHGSPVATGYLGQTPVRLLLDTGAQGNSLDVAFSRQLTPGRQPRLLGQERVTGMSGQQLGQRAVLPELQLAATAWRDVPVVLLALARNKSGALPYQAILGAAFLGQDGMVSFHYGRRKFYTLTPK